MKAPDFTTCSLDKVIDFAKEATPSLIASAISQMNESQIHTVISHLTEKNVTDWQVKVRSAVVGINSRSQLEAVGSKLTVPQFFELINSCLQVEDKHHWKLSPLLVGMPHDTFSKILEDLQENQMQVFKDEGVTEPIQHHLTTFTHEMEREAQKGEDAIDLLYQKIDLFNTDELDHTDIKEVIAEMELHQNFFERLYHKNNKALAIAWNTKRLDLIETLNTIKEFCHKCVLYGLGKPREANQEPTGIYQLLEDKLFQVYGNYLDPYDTEAVRDSEPAVEGLVKLSIWYLRDYWSIGLLPLITNPDDLDLDLNKHSETERVQHRESLFAAAQENLSTIDLKTVKDLKRHYIFSKKTLVHYIKEKLPSSVKSDQGSGRKQ
jgi:hypothetical protein